MGWPSVTIGDVCQLVNGGTPKTKVAEYWDGPHAWITPAEMGGRASPYISNSRRSLSEDGLAKCSASLLPSHSVILSSRAPIGHLVINEVPMATNQGCKGLVPSDELNHKFLYYYLFSIVDLLNDLGAGTTFKELSTTRLRGVPLSLPTLPEQERIVAILDEAFAAIATATANAEKNLANSRELFESEADERLAAEHGDWERTALGAVCERVTVGHVGTTSTYYRQSGIPFLRTQNVTSGGLRLDDLKYITDEFHQKIQKSSLKAGDILMSRVITDRVNCGVVPSTLGEANCANVVVVRPGHRVIPEFLLQYIRSHESQRYLLQRRVGSAQSVVNTGVVKQWPVALPALSVQREIVDYLESTGQKTSVLEAIYEQKTSCLAELKQSILHKAFTGEMTAGTKAADRALSEASL